MLELNEDSSHEFKLFAPKLALIWKTLQKKQKTRQVVNELTEAKLHESYEILTKNVGSVIIKQHIRICIH